MKKRWYLQLVALGVVLAFVLTACGGETAAPEAEPTEAPVAATEAPAASAPTEAPAQTEAQEPTATTEESTGSGEEPVILRVGGLTTVDCWNPWACQAPFLFGDIVYESLTGHGPADTGCEGVPRLAESWEVSEDGLTWTIKLHDGITYSDGTVLDAHEAKAYFDWLAGGELAPWFAETMNMESVEVIDDLTLQYTTSVPILNSPDYDWQWIYFGPTDTWSELPPDELWTYESFPPVGTGPYEVTEHEPGQYIIYDARPDYHLGKPPIDRIVYQVYSNDDTLASALLAGEIDLTYNDLPPQVYETLAADPNITIEEKYPGATHVMFINSAEGGNKHPALDDPAVREAIDYGINKERIIELALLGHGIPCPTNWNCGPYYEGELNPDLKVIDRDPEKANQLLEEAGYLDSDGDGIRETPDGEPLVFRVYYMIEQPTELTVADLISQDLEEVGIALEIEPLESGTYLGLLKGDRDFDLALSMGRTDVDAASMDIQASCWSAEAGLGGLNWAGYCNPEKDDLVYAYWFSEDKEAGQEALYAAQAMQWEDRPKITLAGQMGLQAWRNDRFDFPLGGCDISAGVWDYPTILEAEVK